MSRDHMLISIDDYLKLSNITAINTCENHEKAYDSYCTAHDEILCMSCVLSEHKSCDRIIPLEDAAKSIKMSTTLRDLEEAITLGLKNVQSIIQNTSTRHLDQQEINIKQEIRGFRSKINNRLDEMEQNLISELELKLASYKSMYSTGIKHIKESEKALNRLKEETADLKKLASDVHVFLGTRQLNRELHECLKSTEDFNFIDKYNVSVEIKPVIKSLFKEVKTFGNINTEVTKINITLSQPKIGQAQIHVHPVIKSEIGVQLKQKFTIKGTSGFMYVSGCAILPNGQMLIADFWGMKQLIQYNQDGTHIRDIPVFSKPYDIIVIDSDRVAVSYAKSKYIEILNIKNKKVRKKVKLDNDTWGLYYQRGKLYVVVGGRGIVIIDLSGKMLNTLNIDVSTVRYVTTTTNRIYYSDTFRHTVTCCDMTGKQIWEFRHDSVQQPYGLTVDNNQNVFVVGWNTNNVTIISRDGKTSKTLLTESDGLFHPKAINYRKDNGDLLVCNVNDTKAFLYKVI